MQSFMREHGEAFSNALDRAAQIASGATGGGNVTVEGAFTHVVDKERRVRVVVEPWGPEEGEAFACDWVPVAMWRAALAKYT